MIGEYSAEDGIGSKKRSLTSPGAVPKTERSIMSPPNKKLKQARLPFKVISTPSPNRRSESPATDPLPSKKRKLSGPEKPPALSQPKLKISDAKKFFPKKTCASPVNPKKSRVETINLEPEVTSSCEEQETGRAVPTSTTPKRPQSSKPKCLDSFLQTTQQPQVSTSDGVIDISGDESDTPAPETSDIKEPPSADNPDLEASVTGTVTADERPSSNERNNQASPSEEEVFIITVSSNKADDIEELKSDLQPDQEVSTATSAEDSSADFKLNYDADSEEDCENEAVVDLSKDSKMSDGSSEAESSTSGPASATPVTPSAALKPVKKTPLSAKAQKKLEEKEQNREAKLKLRMDKKRKLEEEEAERKRVKLEMRKKKEDEREEARKQKEAERDDKRKERQQKKEMEDKEKEQKKVAKEEERKKKQEITDAKMEEKRKKNEERLRQEDEKRQQEDEKREKEVKQKNFFKSFFKEAVVPVKKPQEKSCGWFAPFQIKENMVLAPLIRGERVPQDSEEFETAFKNQDCSSLYLDVLRGKSYRAGKMGRTPQDQPAGVDCDSRTATPSAEMVQQDKDSQGVEIVCEVAPKKLVKMKCKLLQFHENYRPAYYGTWRRKSKAINPRNYTKKDEDLLDYDEDSDEEWEEPGESLSHSEGEEDAEDVEEGGDSDDGFFVPHGYLSESEGCEDEEEVENWKERRAAKAKSWEAELKRQQGILKPILVGCVWETNPSGSAASKTLDAYKIVTLVTVPIDTRTKKQIEASAQREETDDSSSKSSAHVKMPGTEGVSLKRPVPAEAMPDLIRLVHGNIAGIRTLQREFREYWRLRDIRKMSERSAPISEMPSTTSTGAEASQEKGPSEGSETSGAVPKVQQSGGPEGDVAPAVDTEQKDVPSLSSLVKDVITPGSEGGTPEYSRPILTSLNTTIGDSVECSISKRQLMLTITAIAVRERRPDQFPRTCWYVHQHLLEKHNLQNLPIPSQWQNITKPQKAVRAESPLVGSSHSALGNRTPVSYAASVSGGRAMDINQVPHVATGHQSVVHPALYGSANSLIHVPQLAGSPYQTPVRLQGGTVAQNLAMARANAANSLSGVAAQQPGATFQPIQLQLANGMSACEIMQRLSATVPVQHQGVLPGLPASPQAHIFSPVTSSDQMHYLNMLSKMESKPYPSSVAGLSSACPVPQTADLGQAVKVPRTSPNDIKSMLSSQAAKASTIRPKTATSTTSNIQPDSSSQTLDMQAAPGSAVAKPPTPTPNCQEEQQQAPSKKVTTLKSFFNVKPVSKPEANQTVKMPKTAGTSSNTGKNTEVSVIETPLPAAEMVVCDEKVQLPPTIDEVVEIQIENTPEEKMEVEVSQTGV